MTIAISALICTRNRAPYLRKALRSLVEQTMPPDRYEIIVVDNNSSDDTPAVVEEFAGTGRVRYLCEPVAGLSRARNTGWRAARGQYVAFLDDDAVAAPPWIEKYLEVFEATTPRPGSVGGKCEPIWEAPRPPWLHERLLSSLSVYDWSDRRVVLGPDQWVSGCNVGYPVDVLREIGGFREDLGRIGTRLLAGEETQVRRQLDALGYATVYDPEIVVGHHIAPARLNKPWFRRHAHGTGQSAAFMEHEAGAITAGGVARAGLRCAAWTLPRLGMMVVARRPDARFYREYQAVESAGYVSGLWQLYRQGKG